MAALPNFRVETVATSTGITIKLAGELDSATCDQLVARFEEVAGAGTEVAGAGPDVARAGTEVAGAGPDVARAGTEVAGIPAAAPPTSREVVLDLSEVSFIDSSGMRAIIIVERSAGERGLTLTIVPPPDALTDLLQITGVADRAALAPQTGDQPAPRPFIERIELELGRETTAPGRARAELREAFSGRLSDSDQATATLLTSELVTNAVIHPPPDAGGSIGLRIAAYADRVRVEVSDPGAGFDAGNLPPRPREMGGQGLFVVDGLSSRWGTARRVIDDQDVFCVWFELDLEYDLSAAPGAPEREIAAAEG